MGQPYIPGISGMATLYDWMAGSIVGYDLMPRDWPFWKWELLVLTYMAAHGALASYGMLMASLSFRHKTVHIAYTACVFLGILFRSVGHYYFHHDASFYEGLVEAVVSGVIVSVVSCYCHSQDKAVVCEPFV